MVNIGPGAVDTPINASYAGNKTLLDKLDAAIPLGRMAEPQKSPLWLPLWPAMEPATSPPPASLPTAASCNQAGPLGLQAGVRLGRCCSTDGSGLLIQRWLRFHFRQHRGAAHGTEGLVVGAVARAIEDQPQHRDLAALQGFQ